MPACPASKPQSKVCSTLCFLFLHQWAKIIVTQEPSPSQSVLVHAILCISSTVNHAIAFSACVSCIRISNHSPWCVPLAGHDQWKQCLIHFAGNCALAHFTGPLIDQDILSLAQLMNSITEADSEGTGRHISSSSSSAPSFPSLCHMAQRLWAPCDAR